MMNQIQNDMPTSGKEGFFAIPLHRVFSYYFTRLVMQNYLMEKDSYLALGRKPKDLFMDILRRHIDAPTGQNVWKYI